MKGGHQWERKVWSTCHVRLVRLKTHEESIFFVMCIIERGWTPLWNHIYRGKFAWLHGDRCIGECEQMENMGTHILDKLAHGKVDYLTSLEFWTTTCTNIIESIYYLLWILFLVIHLLL